MKRMKRVMSLIDHGRGARDLLGIDVVGRDRDLREVVQQVVRQDLDRRHRDEGQDRARAEDAEHVAEVRAGSHPHVLEDVGEDLAPLDDAVLDDQEALLEQDDVRRLLRDVDRGVDRDPDVRDAERRRVVDAVAQESDDVLARSAAPG